MMYANKFVLSVKANNQILRENQGIVALPFGQEFSLLCKNLNSKRAMVSISIDGTDVTGGQRLILQPNGHVDLERYIRNGNMASGNRFKFIQRTSGVEAGRGIKQDDGIVRAEFWEERVPDKVAYEKIVREYIDKYPRPTPSPYPGPYPWRWDGYYWQYDHSIYNTTGGLSGSVEFMKTANVAEFQGAMNAQSSHPFNQMNAAVNQSNNQSKPYVPPARSVQDATNKQVTAKGMRRSMGSTRSRSLKSTYTEQERGSHAAFNDAGITVPGSESHQSFQSVSGFPLEAQSTVIVLQLCGQIGGVAVAAPVTVNTKPVCSTCGKTNKAQNKFCAECGTALVLI